jgi:5'-methylthioadenosine phosphorylase
MENVTIGVIGGSGLYAMPEIMEKHEVSISTPFGDPSAPVVIGTLRGKRVAFLPRHGIGHIFTPSTVPYRANIYALKMLGVRHILAINACGSLREDLAPGHIVIPDQLYDMTKHDRGNTFFDTGMVGHISVADPFCNALGQIAFEAVQSLGTPVHHGGRFVIIEGPRFSTRAESHIFRHLGCDIIGMTTCPEAFLAREAEICYTTMAHITDYDVWHEVPVSVEMVIQTFHHNLEVAQKALAAAVERIPVDHDCACHHALDGAVMTARERISSAMKSRLHPITGRLYNEEV